LADVLYRLDPSLDACRIYLALGPLHERYVPVRVSKDGTEEVYGLLVPSKEHELPAEGKHAWIAQQAERLLADGPRIRLLQDYSILTIFDGGLEQDTLQVHSRGTGDGIVHFAMSPRHRPYQDVLQLARDINEAVHQALHTPYDERTARIELSRALHEVGVAAAKLKREARAGGPRADAAMVASLARLAHDLG
jgi:hypothetical protein